MGVDMGTANGRFDEVLQFPEIAAVRLMCFVMLLCLCVVVVLLGCCVVVVLLCFLVHTCFMKHIFLGCEPAGLGDGPHAAAVVVDILSCV